MLHILGKSRKFSREYFDEESGIRVGKNTKMEPGVIIYDDCEIGRDCIIGTSAVLKSDTKIGDHTIFGTLSTSEGNAEIGSWTTIHSQCHVTWGMKIGSNVFIAPFFYTANTPEMSVGKFGYPNTTDDPRYPPIVKDGVRIGENVGLSPGVQIGEGSLIDMCCLITKNVPPNSHVRAEKAIVGRVIGKI